MKKAAIFDLDGTLSDSIMSMKYSGDKTMAEFGYGPFSVIESLFGKGYFDVVQGQVDGVPIKPDPAGVFRILEQFGLNADEVLYMGDTATDMKTGKAAGAFTVGVLWGFRNRKELEEGHADAIIAHPLELLKYCE